MQIGELFLKLGISGSSTVVKTLGDLKKEMFGVKDAALLMKAAVLASIYGLYSVGSKALDESTSLTNFSALIGDSSREFQKFDYVVRKFGGSEGSLKSFFRSTQKGFTDLLTTGSSSGIAFEAVAKKLNRDIFTSSNIKRFAEKPLELLKVLQQYANTEKDINIKDKVLASFGLSDDLISLLNQNKLNSQNISAAPSFSDSSLKGLADVNAKFFEVGDQFTRNIKNIFATKEGQEFIAAIAQFSQAIVVLTREFTPVITTVIKSLVEAINFWRSNPITDSLKGVLKGTFNDLKDAFGNDEEIQKKEVEEKLFKRGIEPKQNTSSISIDQTLNFQHDGKNSKEVAYNSSQAVINAARNLTTSQVV